MPLSLSNFEFGLVTCAYKSGLGMFALLCTLTFQNWYMVLEGEIGQNLAKFKVFKVKKNQSVIKIKSLGPISPLSSPQNDLNAPI